MTRLLSPRTLERLVALELVTRRAGAGRGLGERPSGAAGAGTIFHEHRTYSPGDDLRYVDWNAYARLRTLQVKVFEHEESVDVHLLVDRSASMGAGEGSKLAAALRVAAMAGTAALARSETVRLQVLPEDPDAPAAARSFSGRASTGAFLRRLDDVAPVAVGRSAPPLGEALRAAFPRLRRRGYGLLVTDFLDVPRAWRTAIDFLTHRRVELTCVHVVAPEPPAAPAPAPLRLRDAETGAPHDNEVDPAHHVR